MGLFKRKKKEEDTRTDIEKKFEEKGRNVGVKTGKLAQKAYDKSKSINEKIKVSEKFNKVRDFASKADDKLDQTVDKVVAKGKTIINNRKQNKEIE